MLFVLSATAQNFDEGLQLYEDQEFEEALKIFEEIDDDRARLFAGKSHFGLQNYLRANDYLRRVVDESDEATFRQEALYTIALSHFRMKNFTHSLDILHEILDSGERGRVRVDAQRFFRQITNYLSVEQRFTAIRQTAYLPVAKELVSSSFDKVSFDEYKALTTLFLDRIVDKEQQQQLAEELERQPRVESVRRQYPTPPEGMVYNVGVILPASENQDSDLLVPRNLYFGITLAAEEFNSQHRDKKIFLNFRDSHRDPDSTATAFHDVVWGKHSDVIIGPLFSQTAERMAGLSETYRIPMIAPLANSDEINLDYNYTFQMNPTFEVHGKRMARHAVQRLGLDTLAVIAQKNALGTASARSFRREAERLGAHISYYIEENFADYGYDLSQFTDKFSTDKEDIESMNLIPTKGIYAPFTGQAATTLSNLLLTDLEVLGSRMVILGSEEWENTSLSNWQNRNFEIYYSQAFGETADTSIVNFVKEDFRTRFGTEPDQFAKIGFDVATYLFNSLNEAGNPAYLGEVLMQRTPSDGLALRIDMANKRVNQHVFIRPLTEPAKNRYSSR